MPIVRPALPNDLEAIARVHTESSRAAYAGIAPADPDGLTRREAAWRDLLGASDFTPCVAEVDGKIVGVSNVGAGREDATVGELYVLYVLPEHWGTGVGQQLLEHAHATLAKRFPEAVLTVLAANPRARRFYERNGWTLERVVTEPHFGGVPTEVARYRRRLQP
jgi:GNAT superfamily N-acetyltransferase